MAMRVITLEIGIDVSKAKLDIARSDQSDVDTIVNEPEAIQYWLAQLPRPARLGVEATNTYHLTLIEAAYRAGHSVYVVDGYCLNQYRKSLRVRAKTDTNDAVLLLRYLNREWQELRTWRPPSQGYRELQRLLHRRATLVQAKTRLKQSLAELPELNAEIIPLFDQFKRLEARLTARLRVVIREHQWQPDFLRCQAIEGIGPITAAALVMAFQRGTFTRSDSFIAFMGLDVRVRDSGQTRGRRKLTKAGDPELRRLLYLAAMQAARSATWCVFYQRYRDRGFTKIQSLVVLARKLARVAFALLKNQSTYQPRRPLAPCTET